MNLHIFFLYCCGKDNNQKLLREQGVIPADSLKTTMDGNQGRNPRVGTWRQELKQRQ